MKMNQTLDGFYKKKQQKMNNTIQSSMLREAIIRNRKGQDYKDEQLLDYSQMEQINDLDYSKFSQKSQIDYSHFQQSQITNNRPVINDVDVKQSQMSIKSNRSIQQSQISDVKNKSVQQSQVSIKSSRIDDKDKVDKSARQSQISTNSRKQNLNNSSMNYDVRKLFKLEDKVENNLRNSKLEGVEQMFQSIVQNKQMEQDKQTLNQISLVDMNQDLQKMFKSNSNFYEPNIYSNFSRMFKLDETQQTNMSKMIDQPMDLKQSFMFMFPDVKIEDIETNQQKQSNNNTVHDQSSISYNQSNVQNSQKFLQNYSNIKREFNKMMDQIPQKQKIIELSEQQEQQQEQEQEQQQGLEMKQSYESEYEKVEIEEGMKQKVSQQINHMDNYLSNEKYKELIELICIEDGSVIRNGQFSNDGNLLCIGSNSRQLRIFDLVSILDEKQTDPLIQIQNYHDGSIYTVQFNKTDDLIVSGSNDKSINIFSIKDQSKSQLKGHSGIVRQLIFDPNNEHQLVSASSDRNVIIWDLNKQQQIQSYEMGTGVNSVCYSDDVLMVVDKSSMIGYDLRMNREVQWIDIIKYADGEPNYIASCLSEMAVAHNNGSVSFWDSRQYQCLEQIQLHSDNCRSVDYNFNGQYLVSSSFDHTACLFDLQNQKTVYKIEQHSDKVVFAKFHPLLDILLTCSSDGTARVFVDTNIYRK